MAINGELALVGAPGGQSSGQSSGSAYVFDVQTQDQLAKLTPDDGAALDLFGASVAIDGDFALVGAIWDDDRGDDSGSAYLFNARTGEQLAKITASDGLPGDRFGISVALDSGIALIGADRLFAGGATGSAYLFDVATGEQLAKLLPSDGTSGDFFGNAVGLSGSTALVGAYGHDESGTEAGAVYLYDVQAVIVPEPTAVVLAFTVFSAMCGLRVRGAMTVLIFVND